MTSSNTPPVWCPSSEVELIVGTPPGGGQDRPARTLMRILATAKLVDVPMRLTNIAGKGRIARACRRSARVIDQCTAVAEQSDIGCQ